VPSHDVDIVLNRQGLFSIRVRVPAAAGEPAPGINIFVQGRQTVAKLRAVDSEGGVTRVRNGATGNEPVQHATS
jgi:hypothetical protein